MVRYDDKLLFLAYASYALPFHIIGDMDVNRSMKACLWSLLKLLLLHRSNWLLVFLSQSHFIGLWIVRSMREHGPMSRLLAMMNKGFATGLASCPGACLPFDVNWIGDRLSIFFKHFLTNRPVMACYVNEIQRGHLRLETWLVSGCVMSNGWDPLRACFVKVSLVLVSISARERHSGVKIQLTGENCIIDRLLPGSPPI